LFFIFLLYFNISIAQNWSFTKDKTTYTINNDNNQYSLIINIQKDCYISSNNIQNFDNSIKITPQNNNNLKIFKYHLPLSTKNSLQKSYYKNQIIIPLEIELYEAVLTELDLNIELILCKEYCFLDSGNIKFKILNNVTSNYNYLTPLKVLFFAFLGGIFLNFMPCVLPLISLKIYQISTLNNKNINLSLFGTIIGIQITMLILALTTFFLKSSGELAGLGFHFQEPIFIITLIIFSLIITLTSTNNYYYTLTNLINKMLPFEKLNIEENFISGIFNGVFIALISTPCTAPFLGIATGYALSGSDIVLFLIYAFIGLGLAIFYILILLNKKLITYIPKSKKWNNYLKVFSQISLYLIITWLIFILKNLTNIRVAIITFCLCLIFKFIVLNKGIITKFRLIKYSLLLLVIITMYSLPQKILIENQKNEQIVAKFWYPYDQEQINTLVNQGKIVLIDITADWCITCKINHLTTLNNIYLIKRLQQAEVKAFRADITKSTPKYIQQLMANFNRQGIPLNILYSKQHPQGILLSILLYPAEIYNLIK